MITDWQRVLAIVLLAVLGGGIVWVLLAVTDLQEGVTAETAGWATAGFLSLREVFSKIEKIALGVRTPERPVEPVGE